MFDQLRATSRAGRSDGRNRQHWLTEFGWDTLAGPVVSPFEQAVFLQRGWMLAMAAGCGKAFWFYNFDSEKPLNFFDGCGLFHLRICRPKLSLAAVAGLTSILPTPQYLGTASVGDNTAGYVFRQDGKLVASLFTHSRRWTRRQFPGPSGFTTISAIRSQAPAPSYPWPPFMRWGLSSLSNLFKQSAYSLDTPYLIGATAGDPIKPAICISNTRSEPVQCDIRPEIPQGWSVAQPEFAATVEPGANQDCRNSDGRQQWRTSGTKGGEVCDQ